MQTGAYGVTPPVRPDFFTPGGRLTLQSNTPIISSDQASKTVIYYTHDKHAYFPVVKNGVIVPVYFPEEMPLTLTSAHSANGIFDIFGVERAGKGRIVTGPAWATPTAGSGDRGTGGGTTELTRASGMRVNRWGIPGLSAEGSTFIAPLEGTYLGTIGIDGSAGQVSCHVSAGQSRRWGISNEYNEQEIILKVMDSTASWTPSGTRPANNATANSATAIINGAKARRCEIRYVQSCQAGYNNGSAINSCDVHNGIGFNSTSATSGKEGAYAISVSNSAVAQAIASTVELVAEYITNPQIGVHTITAMENVVTAGAIPLFRGTEARMAMTIKWMG